MILLAALAGALVAAGLVLGARELAGRPRPPGPARPVKPRMRLAPQRWRMLLSVLAAWSCC